MLRGILVAALFLAPFALADEVAPGPAPWWRDTVADTDGDRLHDALPLSGAEPVTVLVAYDEVPRAAERAAMEDAGFPIVRAYEHFDVLAVRALPGDLPRLLDLPGVVFVELNDAIHRQLKESVPLIGAPQVWKSYGATGKGVVIAVIDDGAFEQHPDFGGKVKASFDAGVASAGGPLSLAANIPVVPASEEGHATHVAGTIVGTGGRSGGSYKGVAPGATFVDVKVFLGPNQTSSDIVLNGLDWTLSNADRYGIRVASMSLGGSASDGKDALSRAVNVAVDKGMIVVAAAGNTGPDPETIASPGAAEKAITVGAVDKKKAIARYSARGPTLDGRGKPDIVAPGSAITSTIPPASFGTARNLASVSAELFYGQLSGTSMAAPHVSGVIALMLEVNPDLEPFEVKQILAATAQDLGAKGRDNETGYGFVNAIAAVQVAEDPALLGSPQFAAILGTLPEPAEESFMTRAQYEIESAIRTGRVWTWAILAAVALIVLVSVGLVARARKRRKLLRP